MHRKSPNKTEKSGRKSGLSFHLKTLILAMLMLWGMTTNDNVIAQTVNLGGFDVSYNGSSYNSDTNQTTFSYSIAGTPDAKQAMNHFTVGIHPDLVVVGSSPSQSVSVGFDPDTGIQGIEWNIGLNKNESRSYSVTLRGQCGEASIGVGVKVRQDGLVGSLPGPSAPPPNNPPTISGVSDQTVWEDNPVHFSFTVNDQESSPGNLAIQVISHDTSLLNPGRLEMSGAGSERTITWYPETDKNGGCLITLSVSDGQNSTSTKVYITILAVNDAPSFIGGADQTVSENAGAQVVGGWATGISAGPPDETGQSVAFLVTNDNNGLFSGQPSLSPDGTLTYTPAENVFGHATVTIRLQDNGGTDSGGIDASGSQTFGITVLESVKTPTPTPTDTPLVILIDTPTETATPTDTPVPTDTPTETATPTDTPVPTDTPTETATPTDTP
ncbi:MAG: hypothetical protein C4527_03985, partial [Candidatus Omnitrophota bacterium]